MALTATAFSEVHEALTRYARQQHVELHDGLFVGLANYSNHFGVRDLPEEDLKRVLLKLGTDSIDLVVEDSTTWPNASGAALIRVLYLLGCTDAFGNCSRAAESILGRPIATEPYGLRFQTHD